MKISKKSLANGFALATGVLWTLCSLFVAILPDFSHTVTRWWMHGMDLTQYNLTLGSFIWGGLTIIASFWLVGFVLGWSLEFMDKRNLRKHT